jgi:hypothetical protein
MRVDGFDRWLQSLASRGEVRAGAFFTAAIVAGVLAVPPPAAAHDAMCSELWNPHGQTTPPAGSTTLPGAQGGQNEDGFYEVGACLFDDSITCPDAENPEFAAPCFCPDPSWEEPVFLTDGCPGEEGGGTGFVYDFDPSTPEVDPFPFGTVIKYIEANGRLPGQQLMAGTGQPGTAGDESDSVEWQLWGQGDLQVCAEADVSACVCCHVPEPPK